MRHVFEHSFPAADTRGILSPSEGRRAYSLTRLAPSDDLAELIDWHWTVRWDLPPGASFTQAIVPHPCVNLVAQAGELGVFGTAPGVDSRTLWDRGHVVAVKFRPGGFRVLDDRPATALVGQALPAAAVFGSRGRSSGAAGGSDDHDGVAGVALELARDPIGERAAAARLESYLRSYLPTGRKARMHRDRLDLVHRAFARLRVRGSDAPRRVDDLADAASLSVRSLQRLFADYVGVSPKWVLMRHRVHLAAERIAEDPRLEIAALADELGYADQSHFTTDFLRAVGSAPGAYAARCAEARSLVAGAS
jgi:AraC-like DNA-binding protein